MLEKYGVVIEEEESAKEKDVSLEDLAKMQRDLDRRRVIEDSPKGTKVGPSVLPGRSPKGAPSKKLPK